MKKHDGYTLIELLLYVAITGILLAGLTAFFTLSLTAKIKNDSILEVDRQGTFMMDTIVKTLRTADSITAPATGATGSALTLVMTPASVNPTAFTISGTTLRIAEGAGAPIALHNSRVAVSGFTIRNLSRASTPGTVQVSFTLSTVNTTGRNEYDYQKSFVSTGSLR